MQNVRINFASGMTSIEGPLDDAKAEALEQAYTEAMLEFVKDLDRCRRGEHHANLMLAVLR